MEERPLECALCKRKPTVTYKELKNGRVDSCCMCSMCPVLQTKIGVPSDEALPDSIEPNLNQICPNCQTCLHDVTVGGTVGCSKCYDAFGEFLTKELTESNATPIHMGKSPDLFRNEDVTKKLDSLRLALTEALTLENYERAASLRDQIKTLNEKLFGKERKTS